MSSGILHRIIEIALGGFPREPCKAPTLVGGEQTFTLHQKTHFPGCIRFGVSWSGLEIYRRKKLAAFAWQKETETNIIRQAVETSIAHLE